MSILEEKALHDLKWNYNYNLGRYYKGCKYCETHPKEINKWFLELVSIADNINILIKEIMKYQEISNKEVLEGFKNV